MKVFGERCYVRGGRDTSSCFFLVIYDSLNRRFFASPESGGIGGGVVDYIR